MFKSFLFAAALLCSLAQQAAALPAKGSAIPCGVFAEILAKGDIAKLEAMIAQGYDVNAPLKKGEETAPEDRELKSWPIVEAAKANSYPAVKCLLAHGADLNVENDAHVALSLRPITYAAGSGNVAMFKMLTEAGAKLSWPDQYVDNGLFDGCLCDIIHNKDTELLKYALGYKANPNASNCQGDYCRHPMAMAAGQNDLEALKLLVRHGGDVNYQDPYGTSALLVAIRNGSLEVVRFILENGGDPQKPGTDGDAIDQKVPLAYAKELGHDAIIAELLKYGAALPRQARQKRLQGSGRGGAPR